MFKRAKSSIRSISGQVSWLFLKLFTSRVDSRFTMFTRVSIAVLDRFG